MQKITTISIFVGGLILALPQSLLGQTTSKGPPRIQAMEKPTYPLQHLNGKPPTIDGSLADWPKGIPALILDDPRQLSGTAHKSWRGKQDFGGRGALLWDEKYLYFGLFLIDDWSRPFLKRGGRGVGLPPSGDSVQLRFDPLRNSRRVGPDEGRREDIEYWFGADIKSTQVLVSRRYLDVIVSDSKIKAVMLYNKKQHFYTLEVRIPWKEILVKTQAPKEGLSLDLQILLNDFDALTDPLPQTRIGWTFGMGPIIDPMIYGTLVLVGKSWDSPTPPKAPPIPKGEREKVDEVWCKRIGDSIEKSPVTPWWKNTSKSRNSALEELDSSLAAWPRQDIVELLTLTQRRMNREVSGYLNTGVLRFLREKTRSLLKDAQRAPSSTIPKIHSLPGRGWWIESKQGNFFIDPCFPLLELFHKTLDACLLTRSQSPLLRSDPLAFRLVATKKPVVCHVAFHLGGAGPLIIHPLNPGEEVVLGKGVTASLLGKKGVNGKVTITTGFQMVWPSGFTIIAPSLSGVPEQIKTNKQRIDVLILDPSNPKSLEFIKKLKPQNIILEGFFDFQRFPPSTFPKSHRLPEVLDLANAARKNKAKLWLLAPGEAWRSQ